MHTSMNLIIIGIFLSLVFAALCVQPCELYEMAHQSVHERFICHRASLRIAYSRGGEAFVAANGLLLQRYGAMMRVVLHGHSKILSGFNFHEFVVDTYMHLPSRRQMRP
jgi:hypothetical protein